MAIGAKRSRAAVASLVSVVAAAVLSACGGTGATASSHDTLRLAVANTNASLPVLVAEKEGFFKEQGLTVSTTVLADISKIPPALGHQFDIGAGVQPLVLKAAATGLDVTVVSGNGLTSRAQPEMLVLAAKGSGIRGPADLEGKRIATPVLGGNLHLATLYWLKKAGVDLSSVHSVQVPTPSMLDQLKSGAIDAAEVVQPFAAVAQDAGMTVVGYPMADVADPTGMTAWVSSGSWADAHESQILAFRKALDEAIAWIHAHPDQAQAMLADFTKAPVEVVAKAPIQQYGTAVSAADLAVWLPVLREVDDFTGNVDPSHLVAFPVTDASGSPAPSPAR